MGAAGAGPSSRGPDSDSRDYNRELPNPARQTPRDTDFQELEDVRLLCHLVQSQLTRTPGSALSP